MKKAVFVLLAVAAAATPVFAGGRHCEALRLALASNDVSAAEAAVSGVDWRGVSDPAAELRGLGRQVEGRPGFEGVARGLKTKLRLLTPGAKMDGGDGTMAVPMAEAPVVAVVPVPIPCLRVVCVPAGAGLYMPVAFAERIPMPVVSSRSAIADGLEGSCGAFAAERDRWARRYGKLRRFLNADGTEFSPDWGTSLHRLRQEAESGADRYDALIDAYNERMERALWRKKMLREVR